MFIKGKWIWNSNEYKNDEYVDFIDEFSVKQNADLNLKISVDGIFTAYLNDQVVGFGACSDDPNNKRYDCFNIEKFAVKGKNVLKITVWHHGGNCATYMPDSAGCIYEIVDGENVVSYSSEKTLSRINNKYLNGYEKYITVQVGYSFKYDNTIVNENEYSPSVAVDKSYKISRRPIKNLVMGERVPVKIIFEGKRVTIDLLKETVGFVDIDASSDVEQEILFSYGEHLNEAGEVKRIMHTRDFSFELKLKKGRNEYLNTFRRIAGRYIQFESEYPVDISYLGIRPVNYPVNVIEKKFKNPLHQKIYDVGVYTLTCCMHEHYEDCPWREQALYALDSRNQMLCGYTAFKEYQFARHSLVLLARGYLEEEKLLNLTYPRGGKLPIPSFSLVYPLQVLEYIEHSKDYTILDEVGNVLQNIMQNFTDRIDENGLIPTFPYPCWNFYEWTEGNHNDHEIGRKENDEYYPRYDLNLNAMYVYSMGCFDKIFNTQTDLSRVRKSIEKTFYDKERGLYKNSTEGKSFSVLANALTVLSGVADKQLIQKVIDQRETLTDLSLSMNGFLYEALIQSGGKYTDYIINDIEKKYSHMLDCGATTFWETILGKDDFDGAGSLCHGWSALPVYWLDKLVK